MISHIVTEQRLVERTQVTKYRARGQMGQYYVLLTDFYGQTFAAINTVNLQATKLFIVTPATKGWVVTTHPGFRVRFKILYRVIQPLIQHCLLNKMVYLNIIYVIATRNYEFFTTGVFP